MNAIPSRGRMKVDGLSVEVATVDEEGNEGSSEFARMEGIVV